MNLNPEARSGSKAADVVSNLEIRIVFLKRSRPLGVSAADKNIGIKKSNKGDEFFLIEVVFNIDPKIMVSKMLYNGFNSWMLEKKGMAAGQKSELQGCRQINKIAEEGP